METRPFFREMQFPISMAQPSPLTITAVIIMAVWMIAGCVSVSHADDLMKALIIDGQMNRSHKWCATSPVLQRIIEDTGMFAVDRATSPPQGSSMSGFAPRFSDYDVVILNYDGDHWPDKTKQSFAEYVRSGGGVIVYHSADNAFSDWPEYNAITGLGGWGGRTENDGPMVRWRDGKMVRDSSPGKAGQHPKQHEFQVIVRAPDHPIMAGLPKKWMNGSDELYSKLRGPARNLTVLATAYADPEIKGTGEHEPILFTVEYGKGRVFHTPLGHGADNMRCIAFTTTLQRGAEWAATGRVTCTAVPADFPTSDTAGYREDLAARSDDLDMWEQPTGEWQAVGEVFIDPEDSKRLAWKPGESIIVNDVEGTVPYIFSKGRYGDVEAHIEFIVPEGSNSGVYFQGRYEIQVYDSWGVEKPGHRDCGGIYQRWKDDESIEKSRRGYEGRPPRVNAARRPGQWQSFDVVFMAPRFDETGKKIANATFVRVVHNGVTIHENQEVTGPTRSARFKDEQPFGPIVLQGNHGPVAYRNIRVRPLGPAPD